MAMIRTALVVSALVAGPTMVFEPHLKSIPNPEALKEHEYRLLSQMAQAGAHVYNANCQGCHGKKGIGTDLGPSLWGDPYRRGDRVQKEFHLALTDGGDQKGGIHGGLPASRLAFNDIEKVARYVREARAVELSQE